MRLIEGGESGYCEIAADAIADHFCVPRSDAPDDLSFFDAETKPPEEINVTPLTVIEVRTKLKAAESTAPGPDRLTYAHWRSVDPDARVLTAIYKICQKYKRIPPSWKESRTILIHKKGDREDCGNWRPIAMSSVIAKLYASCLAKRLLDWITKYQVLSDNQKGFLPHDGVFENNYVIEAVVRAAKKKKHDILLASLDLSNAFGSVPHWAIFGALAGKGAGGEFIECIKDIYDESNTIYVTGEGESSSRSVESGVRQGCPLSGLLFNISIDFILRNIQRGDATHELLAYADDVILISKSISDLQAKLDSITELADKINLKFNASKCYTMHYSCVPPAGARSTVFYIKDNPVPGLGDGDHGVFLGKPIGTFNFSDTSKIEDLKIFADKILTSKLAPWQRLDAIKTFFFPSILFALRTNQFSKSDLKSLDKHIRPHIKKTLNLPVEAANEYLYGSRERGLMSIPVTAVDLDIAHVDGAFKLLTSKDPRIRELAWGDLIEIANFRFRNENFTEEDNLHDSKTLYNVESYLSSVEAPGTSDRRNSIWSRARVASADNRLKLIWKIDSNHKISISNFDSTLNITDRTKIFRSLRAEFRERQVVDLGAHSHQGKTLACTSLSKATTHFHGSGNYTRFAEWRFVHRARLGLVPLNAYTRGGASNNKGCRRCRWRAETLPHVLNHCHMQLNTKRHDLIIKRLKKAAVGRWTVYRENQTVDSSDLRPDLVLKKGNQFLIIDVTCPFENGPGVFSAARREKVDKYTNLANNLKTNTGCSVDVEAIVVGSLGSWDPKNDKTVRRLCSKKYADLMRKLIVSETLRASRNIYIEHLTGVPQI